MSVGEFREDAAEFQARSVSTRQHHAEVWDFLGQRRPCSLNFCGCAAQPSSEQSFLGVAPNVGRLRKGMGLRDLPLRLGQSRCPFGHGTHAHLDSRGNAPTEVLASVNHIHGDACAHIDDQPCFMTCGVGKTMVKHSPSVGHPVQSESFGRGHLCGQGSGVPRTQHQGFRERRDPWFQVATAGHHDLVFEGHVVFPYGGDLGR